MSPVDATKSENFRKVFDHLYHHQPSQSTKRILHIGDRVCISIHKRLQKTDQTIYRIDRIIRKRLGEVLVKWSGYPDQFNSWIPETDVQHSGRDIIKFE